MDFLFKPIGDETPITWGRVLIWDKEYLHMIVQEQVISIYPSLGPTSVICNGNDIGTFDRGEFAEQGANDKCYICIKLWSN